METIEAIILGLVHSVSELLPVSSSGHLIIFRDLLTIDEPTLAAYALSFHAATLVALILYFRSDIWALFQVVLRKLGRLPVKAQDLVLPSALCVATIPSLLIGFFIQPFLSGSFQSIAFIASMFLVASVFFMYVEWRYFLRPTHDTLTVRRAALIGCFQAIALLPGFSHIGVTLAGGMLLGMSRYDAARFSFLLAIPVGFGVVGKKLIDLLKIDGSIEWQPILIGACVACAVSFLVVHLFLGYIKRNTLWPFIWYGVILSALVGYISFIS